jgi:hypothetical protein
VSALWTITHEGRHAVEVTPPDGTIALYRMMPTGLGQHLIGTLTITLKHGGGNTYRLMVETRPIAVWKLKRPADQVGTAFAAYDHLAANTVVRGLVRAWAQGRLPVCPSNRRDSTAWRLYIDATADAVMVRRARALRP